MADISGDPLLKARILDGSFFEWTCTGCSRRFFVDEVFLCCDSSHGFCVYLVPGYSQDTLPVPTLYKSRCSGLLRVTSSYVDFVEKLRILSAGLDDRIIEAIKAFYASACHQADGQEIYNIIFEELRPDEQLGFAVFLKEQDVSVDIPAKAYAQAKAELGPLLPDISEGVFYKIDQNWLAKALSSELPGEAE
jgi:hypothetical protein